LTFLEHVLNALIEQPLNRRLAKSPPRAQEIDLLRSVALVGICLVNLPYLAIPLDVLAQGPSTPADRIAAFGSSLLLEGKVFVLFSFLLFNSPLALDAFALGLAAHRTGFLAAGSAGFAALERRVPVLLAIAVPANLAYALSFAGVLPTLPLAAAGMAALAVGSPALAAVYLWAVVRLARAAPGIRLASGRVPFQAT
jgi:uncharacterized protein